MNHASPLVKKTKEVDERVEWKKANKPKIPPPSAKKILGVDLCGPLESRWVEHWIETFVRERVLPMTLVVPTFLEGLEGLYPLDEAVEIVERLRTDFASRGPVSIQGDTPQSVQDRSLLRVLKSRSIARRQIELETTESPPEE